MGLSGEKKHLALVVFFCCVLLSLIGFDQGEIQPWDEGLYAIRARVVLEHSDAFFDQTAYAVGGSYSASSPPLVVWAMAGAMQLFGETPFAVRLFSLLCHVLSLILIFALARRLVPFSTALLAPLLLTATTLWNTYARQGMTDVPVISWVLLALLSIVKLQESRATLAVLSWSVVLLLATAAALLTKYAVSFLPFVFVGWYWKAQRLRSKRAIAVAAVLLGSAAAAMWYGMMWLRYPETFPAVLQLAHVTTVVENNARAWWYYGNQLLIANPFFVPAVFAVLVGVRRWRRQSHLLQILILWGSGGLLFLSLSATKMPHYAVFVIPPLVLLAVYSIELLQRSVSTVRIRWALLLGMGIALLWALLPALRVALRRGVWDANVGMFGAAVAWILLSAVVFPRDVLVTVGERVQKGLVYGVLFVMLLRIAVVNAVSFRFYDNGARFAARALALFPPSLVGYVYHQHTAADRWNPQLQWYLERQDAPEALTRMPHFPLSRRDVTRALVALTQVPDSIFVLYYALAGEREMTIRIVQALQRHRRLLFATRNYFLFTPVQKERRVQMVRWQIGS